MAKTIFEMAVAYATEDGANGKQIVIKSEKDAALYGADYVLDEIDKICYQSDKTYEERYLMITDLIKELKGE